MAIDIVLDWYIYEPVSWQKGMGYKVHMDQCRSRVDNAGGNSLPHQCGMKPKVTIQGYGFCTRHANEILKRHPEYGTNEA